MDWWSIVSPKTVKGNAWKKKKLWQNLGVGCIKKINRMIENLTRKKYKNYLNNSFDDIGECLKRYIQPSENDDKMFFWKWNVLW